MSRNLCQTNCDRCGGEVKLCGPTAPITREQAGVHFSEYEGMLVADAECTACLARYLAWVDERPRKSLTWVHQRHDSERGFVDLSYRASFNDEPADEDVPPWTKPAELRDQVAALGAGATISSGTPDKRDAGEAGAAATATVLASSPAHLFPAAAPPVALRPAREVAHEEARQRATCDFAGFPFHPPNALKHSRECNLMTCAVLADRAAQPRGEKL